MCTTEPTIIDIRALEIIDNRGRPTIRARVYVEGGHCGMADVPCGSSKGAYEAFALRDGDERYNGVRQSLVLARPFLHAEHLAFEHPISGERVEFDSPLPSDLADLLATLS